MTMYDILEVIKAVGSFGGWIAALVNWASRDRRLTKKRRKNH